MKTRLTFLGSVGKILSAAIVCWFSANAHAQTNSWTNSASGNWQDPYWSLGTLPATNQAIFITNAGWKALAIGPATAQNYPQTLNVNSITISSPTNSFNTLLLNYAGLQAPLVVGASSSPGVVVLSSNSAITMFASALLVQNSSYGSPDQQPYGAFSVGGTFNESESSQVTADFLRVGDVGPGIYNLTNSLLSAQYEYVGGWPSTFTQAGGTNLPGVLEVQPNGVYSLYAGELNGTVQLDNSGVFNLYAGQLDGTLNLAGGAFNQQGGNINASVNVNQYGSYNFSGGILTGGISLPSDDQSGGALLQTGGTNSPGGLQIGYGISFGAGFGNYTLSNGVLVTSGTTVNPWGNFQQYGGTHQINGPLNVTGAMNSQSSSVWALYTLDGGFLTASSLNAVLSEFTQSGGTNQLSGAVTVGPSFSESYYKLTGGAMFDASVTVLPSYNGGFFQSGGIHVVTNLLNISGTVGGFQGYVLSGGELITANIQVDGGAIFQHTGGSISQSGVLTLANGQWRAAGGSNQLGPLQLGVSGGTNSTLSMPNSPCVSGFGNSSSLIWSNQATLTIENWTGSIYGGGNQQIIFGNSAAALTPQQLRQIQFHNPAGLSGTYPARILPDGEITPGPVLITTQNAGRLVLQWDGTATLQTATNAAGPYTDLTGISNPYTNLFTDAQRYFRLHQEQNNEASGALITR